MPTATEKNGELEAIFAAQRKAFEGKPFPNCRERRRHLGLLRECILENRDALVEAVSEDFGNRAKTETLFADILTVLEAIKYVGKRLPKWMEPEKRHSGLLLFGTQVRVLSQPLGVVGVMSPWNYPINLSLVPLVYALAAGNRVMIKMSEFTPRTAELVQTVLAKHFAKDHVAVIIGEADVAVAFSKLPFAHLLFTGSTMVGRHVMRAAAENLVPVTLELGGKSPTVIAKDANLVVAAERICFGKILNAGQTCIAPDYILCPKGKMDDLVQSFRATYSKMFASIEDNPDCTSIVNEKQYDRILALLREAEERGGTLIPLHSEKSNPDSRKLPLHLVTDPPESSRLMQEEIFGPVLPIVAYDTLDDAISYIKERPQPLALYFFGNDVREQQRVLRSTLSGGACVNDVLFHATADDLPFGGVGPSGMGCYHGREGFLTFSHQKAILRRSWLNTAKNFFPPYGNRLQEFLLKWMIK